MRQVPGYPLWLGHVGDVRDLRGVLSAGILAVVDLALNEPPATVTRELVYYRFPLLDGPGNPGWLLRAAVDTVAGLLRSNMPTLVFCGAGMSRTPIVAAAANYITKGWGAVTENRDPEKKAAGRSPRPAGAEQFAVNRLTWFGTS